MGNRDPQRRLGRSQKTARQLDREIDRILRRRELEREGMTLVGRRIGTLAGAEEAPSVEPTAAIPHYTSMPSFHIGGPGSTIAGEPEVPRPRGTTSTWQPGDDERRRKVVHLLSERPKTPQEWYEHDVRMREKRQESERRERERWARERQAREGQQAATREGSASSATCKLPVAKTHNGKKRAKVGALLRGLFSPKKLP